MLPLDFSFGWEKIEGVSGGVKSGSNRALDIFSSDQKIERQAPVQPSVPIEPVQPWGSVEFRRVLTYS